MATASVPNPNFVNGTSADADQVDANFAALVSFLNNSVVHRDGTKAMTAAFDAGSNKIVNVSNGTNANDAVNKSQLDALSVAWTESTGVVRFGGVTTNVTSAFRYRRILGTTIEWECEFTLTGIPQPGALTITFPVAVDESGTNVGQIVGRMIALDASGSRYALDVGIINVTSSTVIEVSASGGGVIGAVASSTAPFSWASGDGGVAQGRYRAAA